MLQTSPAWEDFCFGFRLAPALAFCFGLPVENLVGCDTRISSSRSAKTGRDLRERSERGKEGEAMDGLETSESSV